MRYKFVPKFKEVLGSYYDLLDLENRFSKALEWIAETNGHDRAGMPRLPLPR
jgi:hypothetical protein